MYEVSISLILNGFQENELDFKRVHARTDATYHTKVVYDPSEIELFGAKSDYVEFKTDELVNNVKEVRIVTFLEKHFPPMSSEQIALAPILLIENLLYNFGTIKEREIVSNDFVLTNTGKRELIIR